MESITNKHRIGRWESWSRTKPYRAFWDPEPVDMRERAQFIHKWMQAEEEWRSAPHFQEFKHIRTALFIWRSITLEVQMTPDDSEAIFSEFLSTAQQWNSAADNNTNGDATAATQDEDESWYADGDGNTRDQWVRMLVQGLRAYKYLEAQAQSDNPLTVAVICQAHGLLMQGSMKGEYDGAVLAIPAGQFRTASVSAGDWTFPPHEAIPICVEEIVQNFEKRLQKLHAVEAATLLFYDVISLHPFLDGNGRLSRFLFGYALLRAGFPFPVILSSGASKDYKHYIIALQRAQGRGNFEALYALAWQSVERTIRNANHFMQLEAKREL